MSLNPIRRTLIDNVYRISEAVTDVVPWRMGGTFLDYAPPAFGSSPLLSIICNGRRVDPGGRPSPGDQLSFVVMPAEGISIGASMLISAIISAGLGFISFMLMARPQSPDGGGTSSSTYSFSGIGNTITPGTPIPVGYGKHLVGGQIIGQFRREAEDGSGDSQLWTLLSLGHGPYESIAGLTVDTDWTDAGDIEGLTINGNEASLFDEAYVAVRMGKMTQTTIPDFGVLTVNQNVGVELKQYEAATITTTGVAKKIELNIELPQGQYDIHAHGHRRPYPIDLRYRYRPTGGAWSNWTTKVIDRGYYPKGFTTTISFDLPEENTAEIEVERLKENPEDYKGSNTHVGITNWDSVNLITYDSHSYPGMALLALKVKASGQISDPNVTILSECEQRKVGIWDGVMQEFPTFFNRYSQNPAWAALDLLIDTTYGLGNFITASKHVDLASFEAWADYCDELVDDGRGGTEVRHRFDGRFDTQASAWESFLKICRVGRGIPIKVGGKIRMKINEARDAIQVIGMGNITEGSFKKQWLSLNDRFNMIHCEFRDEELNWEKDTATVEDEDLWENDSTVLERSEEFFGITRRTEVMREGAFAIKCNRLLREIIEFEMGVEGLAAEAGDIIYFAHDVQAERGISGRISETCALGHVKLDRECFFYSGLTYKVIVQDADDDTIEERTIDMSAGIYEAGDQLDVSVDFSFIPSKYDSFVLYQTASAIQEYMIAEVTQSDTLTRKLKCLKYDEDVYDLSAGVTPDGVPEATDIDNVPPRIRDDSTGDVNAGTTVVPTEVIDVTIKRLFISGANRTLELGISLEVDPDSNAQSHTVFVRRVGDEHWTEVATIEMPELTATIRADFLLEADGTLSAFEIIARPNLPASQQPISTDPGAIPIHTVEAGVAPEFFIIAEVPA